MSIEYPDPSDRKPASTSGTMVTWMRWIVCVDLSMTLAALASGFFEEDPRISVANEQLALAFPAPADWSGTSLSICLILVLMALLASYVSLLCRRAWGGALYTACIGLLFIVTWLLAPTAIDTSLTSTLSDIGSVTEGGVIALWLVPAIREMWVRKSQS
jgi:hypothetical protein